MDRLIVYPGAIPLDTDILSAQRNTMIALGSLAQAVLGTSTVVDGLACTQTTVPSMSVSVAPGSLFTLTTVDATAFGSLASDTTDALVKFGTNLTATTLTMTAPVSAGQSINYLVEAAFLEADGTSVVLPYYNAATPASPYSGPSGGGAAQNTLRTQRVQVQLKAGTAAATGSQTTPAVDAGWVGLYAITVAFGAVTVVNANIAQLSTAPFIDPLKAGHGVQSGRLINVRTISASATYTPTLGTASIEVELVGGGGGGGGAAVTGAGQCSAGAGGGAGGRARKRITSAFSGVTMTIGAGGTTSAGAAGGNGGTTSFGAIFSATGGIGGTLGAAASNTTLNMVGSGLGGAGVSGDDIGLGGAGHPAFYAVSPVSGKGGASTYGEGGIYASGTSSGTAASSPGAGGSGACLQASAGAAATGGVGAAGLIVIYEYS